MFNKLSTPIFLKENYEQDRRIAFLESLSRNLTETGQKQVANDIKNIKNGIKGEKNIAFELRNSNLPMYVIHDFYIEHGDSSTQIDFLVFTRKNCFVIESKNLYGTIVINNRGDFIPYPNKYGKIYSPITQNNRHIEVLKKVRKKEDEYFILKFLRKILAEERYQSVVVMTNPSMIIKDKEATDEVKSVVVQVDQLIQHIKNVDAVSKNSIFNDKDLKEWAESYLAIHQENDKMYDKKYEHFKIVEPKIDKENLKKLLTTYRLEKSKEENIRAFYVFSNKDMDDLLLKMPKSIDELMNVQGFSDKRVAKYGADIIRILHGKTK